MQSVKAQLSKVYFGWWTVLATGILSGFGHGFYGSGISVFFKDIAAELELNRAVTSLAAGIGRPAGGITSPLIGWLSDKYGPKWVIFTGICIAGTGMMVMSIIQNVWQYMVVWGLLIGVGLNIGLTVAVDKSLNDWFILRRGLAQGTKFGLIGVGSVIVVPIVTVLVTMGGWRTACLIWGGFILLLSPLALAFVKQYRPEHYGLLPDGAKPAANDEESDSSENSIYVWENYQTEETEFSFRQAIRTRAYWFMSLSLGFQMLIMGGVNIHFIPFLTDIGISRVQASGMMALMLTFTIPSRFLAGIVADYIGKKYQNLLLTGGFLMQSLGLGVFLWSRSMASVYFFLILYGFSSGATTPLFILTLGRYFGRMAFGTIFGSSMLIRAPISLVAPVFTGWVFDTTGSYIIAFSAFAVFSTIAAVIMAMVRPVQPPLEQRYHNVEMSL